jgi:acetyl-CoA C-acetyltransferase
MFFMRGAKLVSRVAPRGILHREQHSKAVILAASRTPIASWNSSLASVKGPELGAVAIRSALEKSGLAAEDIDEAFIGNVASAGQGQAPARQAVVKAGLGWHIPCTTIHKVCASGTKATMLGASSIETGINKAVIAGGFESMSNIPYYLPRVRQGLGYGHGVVEDGVLKDGLTDAYEDQHMGMCAEACAAAHDISREAQDDFAIESYARAQAAAAEGRFDAEICPVTVKGRKGDVVVDKDEEPSKVKLDKIKGLRPAFKKDGTVTAANASSLNDGAAALILASEAFAAEKGLAPLARVIGQADAARQSIEFTIAPADAIPKAIAHAGLTADDIGFYEINEAFSVVSLANNKLLGLDPAKVNVNGGAVSLGHPIGASGARIIVTLVHVLQQRNARYGVAGICNGGGGASAIVIENLQYTA